MLKCAVKWNIIGHQMEMLNTQYLCCVLSTDPNKYYIILKLRNNLCYAAWFQLLELLVEINQ